MTLSIYIPRIFTNISTSQIAQVFESLDLGKIERIDMIPYVNAKGEPLYRAFVYIKWANNTATNHLQAKILDPEQQAKIVYQEPWYWLLLPNKTPMTAKEVATERRIETLEHHVKSLTEANNYQDFMLHRQGKIIRELSREVCGGAISKNDSPADPEFHNPEQIWFEKLEWLDRVLACENIKESSYMKKAFESEYLYKVGRNAGEGYNASYEDYCTLHDMYDFAKSGLTQDHWEIAEHFLKEDMDVNAESREENKKTLHQASLTNYYTSIPSSPLPSPAAPALPPLKFGDFEEGEIDHNIIELPSPHSKNLGEENAEQSWTKSENELRNCDLLSVDDICKNTGNVNGKSHYFIMCFFCCFCCFLLFLLSIF